MTDFTAPHIDLQTGAWQDSYFEAVLAQALSHSRKEKRPFALLWVDVDDLQEHNDVHGQPVLDEALSWLVSELAACVNGRGPIGRLGPDEFGIFVSDMPQTYVQTLGEELVQRARSRRHPGATPEQGFVLTISVGIAVARNGEPSGNLLDAAKDACLKAKQAGRNILVMR